MAMTGKYAGTSAIVPISEAVEEAILERMHHSVQPSGEPVEFHCCSDGLLAAVPVSGWERREGTFEALVLGWPKSLLAVHGNYLDDLRAIYEARPATDERYLSLQKDLQVASLVPKEE